MPFDDHAYRSVTPLVFGPERLYPSTRETSNEQPTEIERDAAEDLVETPPPPTDPFSGFGSFS